MKFGDFIRDKELIDGGDDDEKNEDMKTKVYKILEIMEKTKCPIRQVGLFLFVEKLILEKISQDCNIKISLANLDFIDGAER